MAWWRGPGPALSDSDDSAFLVSLCEMRSMEKMSMRRQWLRASHPLVKHQASGTCHTASRLKHALNQGKGNEMCLRRVENVRSKNLLLQRFRHSVLLQNHVDRASRSHEDKKPKLINHCCLVNPN